MAFNPATDVGPIRPSGGGMPGFDPFSMAMGGLSGLGNFFAAKAQAKAQKEMNERNIAADAARQNQQVAFQESQLDPFRQQMKQAKNLSMLDMRERMNPARNYGLSSDFAALIGVPAMDRSQPTQPTYTPSADLLKWLAAVKTNVAGGQNQAPTMTNPANYGQTSALDLVSLGMGNGTGDRDPYYAVGANRPRPGMAVPRMTTGYRTSY